MNAFEVYPWPTGTDTSGFYRYFEEDDWWMFGPNSVRGPEGAWEINRENHEDFNYPYEGWTWYDESPQAYIDWWIANFGDEEEAE